MMKLPVTDLSGNLVFTRYGTVWATWRLQGLAYGDRAVPEKEKIKRLHEELLQAFTGEVVLSGITASLDVTSIAERMLAGIDLQECPDWAEEVGETLDVLEDIAPGTRTFWLSVPLRAATPMDLARRQWQVLKTEMSERLALPGPPPTDKMLSDAMTLVARVQEAIPARFKPRPATPAEHLWLALHHQQRGLGLDSTAPAADHTAHLGIDEAFGHRGYPEPYLEPSGLDEQAEKNEPIYRRRWVKIANELVPSFQIIQAITSFPSGGFAFPGGEWMQQADAMPFDVDWIWRLQIESAARAKFKNRKAENRYIGQMQERADDTAITGSANELDATAADIAGMQAALSRSAREVKTSVAVLFAVGAPTAEEAQAKASMLRQAYSSMEIRLEQFMGKQQEQMWWQLQIGTPTSREVIALRHDTTAWHLSGAVPLTDNSLGGTNGMLFALTDSGGRPMPVLLDLEAQMMGNHSASMAANGELGAGKTHVLKLVFGATLDRGGRGIVVDPSATREWKTYAESIADATTLDFGAPEYSLDPLRLLGPDRGASHVEALAATLFNVAFSSAEGVLISEALQPQTLEANNITSMNDLMGYLLNHETELARELGNSMKVISTRPVGRVLFDDSLPPMPLDSPGLVFCTNDLQLPSTKEIEHEHLYRQLRPEKIFGRALYTLIAALAEYLCFRDTSEMAGFFLPECHRLTSNLHGDAICSTFVKEGRKAKAFVVMDAHETHEYGTSAGLIPIRILMRHTDPELAKAGLEWINLKPTDELIERVTNFSPLDENENVIPGREGEAFLLDHKRRAGQIKVIVPARKSRALAMSSTPEQRKARHANKISQEA